MPQSFGTLPLEGQAGRAGRHSPPSFRRLPAGALQAGLTSPEEADREGAPAEKRRKLGATGLGGGKGCRPES